MQNHSGKDSAAAIAYRLRKREARKRPPRLQTLLWQRIVLGAMTAAAARLQKKSRPAALRFGERLGNTAYRLAQKQRKRADSNLRLAYRDTLSDAERDTLIRGVFRHFGRVMVDFLRLPSLDTDALSALVTAEGWEYVETALQDGKGVILITAHIGNWEILGRWLSIVKGVPLTVVAREPKQPAFAQYIRSMREGGGFAVLNKGESARDLIKALRSHEVILLLPDQNSGDLFVPFFGTPAGTVAGPAALALRTGAALLPIYCLQNPDGTYRVVCLPPVPACPTGGAATADADVARITAETNRVLENVIRQYPEQWLWLHNRWKSAFEKENHELAWGSSDDAAYQSAEAFRRG